MKLNIGSGYVRIPGYHNVDHDPMVKPDYLADLENLKLDDIPDNTVDEVLAHHVLEHIGNGFFSLMQELYRVCKHDAVIDVKFPHHRSEIWFGDPTHCRKLTVDQFRMFSKKENLSHIAQYGSSSGFGLKLDVDYEILGVTQKLYPKWEERFKTMSDEEITEVIENFNNVFWEVHLGLRVVKVDAAI
jgi:ubiquinone/menaquinone biosynthesis C-methylase UbiE